MATDNDKVYRENGAGWNDLIEPIMKRANELGATVTQVKEKLGMLRIYFSPGQADCSDLEEMIEQAEIDSATRCEMCGQPGITMTTGSWLKTLCKEHSTELGYRRKA